MVVRAIRPPAEGAAAPLVEGDQTKANDETAGADGKGYALGKLEIIPAADIGRGISSVLKGDLSNRESLQKWATQAVAHAAVHGDYSLIDRLTVGLFQIKSQNLRGLAFALQMFTPLVVDLRSGKVSYYKAKSARGQRLIAKYGVLYAVDQFAAQPFWELAAVQQSNARPVGEVNLMDVVRTVAGLKVKVTESFRDGSTDEITAARITKLLGKFEADLKAEGLENQFANALQSAEDRAEKAREKREAQKAA